MKATGHSELGLGMLKWMQLDGEARLWLRDPCRVSSATSSSESGDNTGCLRSGASV